MQQPNMYVSYKWINKINFFSTSIVNIVDIFLNIYFIDFQRDIHLWEQYKKEGACY